MLDPILIDVNLSIEEYKRYSRHLILDKVGKLGQSRLKASKVLIVGLGGLGSLASMYLAAAGVGQIGIVEYDRVSVSNLQRQLLYDSHVIDKRKSLVGKLRLEAINPYCNVVVFDTKLTTTNASIIIADYDLIIDASDNFFTRYLINDIAILFNIPVVYGAILNQEGQISVFNYRGGPTYRDLFGKRLSNDIALSCSEGGVFGGVAAVISSLQVNEVIKIILGLGNVLSGKLLIYDFFKVVFKTIVLKKKLFYSRKIVSNNFKELSSEEVKFGVRKDIEESREVYVSEIKGHIDNKSCLVIDVRTKQEYEVIHLMNAKNIPLSLLSTQSTFDFIRSKLNQGFYILIYCSADARSITATNIFSHSSIDSLRLVGGLKALGF
nr:moeB [Erythrotrichia longistipitata]